MNFINSFTQITYLRDEYQKNKDFITIWKEYITQINPKITNLCLEDIKSYSFEQQVLPVISAALTTKYSQLQLAHDNFVKMQNELITWSKDLFGDIDVDIYFIIGLCNGAGWVTLVGDRPSILLGGEKFVELSWCQYDVMKSIIAHEIGHVVQFNYRKEWNEDYSDLKQKACYQLYTEGFAQYCQIIASKNDIAHGVEWENWCYDNEEMIKAEFLRRIEISISVQGFFGDWCSVFDHSDLGYFLGLQFIKHLLETMSLYDASILPIGEVESKLISFLHTER